MCRAVHRLVDLHPGHQLTRHAWERMSARSLPPDHVRWVLEYGRVVHTRGASIYVIGRRDVERFLREEGVDLSAVEGIQVVCSKDGTVLTAYRNRDLSGLKPRARRTRRAA